MYSATRIVGCALRLALFCTGILPESKFSTSNISPRFLYDYTNFKKTCSWH